MRAFGRDLIRGGHCGQRSCEPHLKAEHMAGPTNAAKREESSCQHGAVHTWHIASFRWVAEFGPLLGLNGLRRAVGAADLWVHGSILRHTLSSAPCTASRALATTNVCDK